MSQVDMYIAEIPMLEYRRAWPVAVMIAQMGNFQGGRSRKKTKETPDTVPYKPEDFLSYMWFAQYEPYLELTKEKGKKEVSMGIDQETARLIVSLNTHEVSGQRSSLLESWMIAAFGPAWAEVAEKAED